LRNVIAFYHLARVKSTENDSTRRKTVPCGRGRKGGGGALSGTPHKKGAAHRFVCRPLCPLSGVLPTELDRSTAL